MPLNRIELLVHAWSDRYKKLLTIEDIKYVLPFENRGEECGVTLYTSTWTNICISFIPPTIQKEMESFNKENFLIKIMKDLEKNIMYIKTIILSLQSHHFTRYAYEVWIMPKKQKAGPWLLMIKK